MRITYLFDPLCGWCYGAGPMLEQIARLDDVTLELAPTGLFAGEAARPMDQHFAAYAWQNDQRIARLTGQPFTEAYRTNILGTSGTFDSAPTTLGLVAVGLTDPNREFEALKLLQRARYIDGRDNSNPQIVADLLERAQFADAARRVGMPDDTLITAYRRRIEAARADMARFAVEGVPALVVGDGAERRLVSSSLLFGRFELLAAQLRAA
ncbi:DsbA family protein [Bradyrhizobium manausense]|uniref:DsbA family protein n=1 Tax=Bradyrhizobium manausense TaxID=989370 RepID=UPI001BA763DE|nr:DsbA family protein [Bradyrhizobium manausense]MBR0725595.1 DsbA family protein [Bradyrhizobium manausense]